MNARTLALGALVLATVVSPSFIAAASAASKDASSCIFQAKSDRDGTWCNSFSSSQDLTDTQGLAVVTKAAGTMHYDVENGTRGSSGQRN